jgi:uncharacterized protein (DUF885 family)
MSAIYDLADDYVVRYAALSPNAATSMGIPGHETELTDFSPDGHEARAALERETLAALTSATLEDDRDRVARDAMAESMRLSGELYDAGERFRSLNILASPLQSLRRVFDLMPRESEEHWSNIAARLAALPAAVDGLRRTLDTGIERGMVSTQRQASECAKQCATWSGAAGAPSYFDGLVEAFEASEVSSEGLAGQLRTGAAAANEAFAGFARYLDETYVPAAEPHDPVGRDRYALGVQVFTGASPDLDETYAWGWSELHRIEAEMEATAERIAPGVGVEGVKELLESDPERAIDGVDAFQQWMQNLQETTIAELNGTHFDLPEEVQRIEALIAPPGGPLAMYYTGPSEDFSRPGRTWYPTAGKTRFPLWGEVSIAYHEGVPGHHLQIGMTVYLREHLSRWQRLMGGSSGYSEGWGLYAERLMGELGYLENPDYYLGMLRAQALRCARVVVDIGMHLELPIAEHDHFHPGETWTPELGLEFVLQRAHFPADFMASEVDRYLGLPGQAISYKVGERAWLDAREAARARDGASFDLAAFHAQAFELGPMGLDQMRREFGG